MSYSATFTSAVQKTCELGFPPIKFDRMTDVVATPDRAPPILKQMAKYMDIRGGQLCPEDIAARCADANWKIKPLVEEVLGVPAILTIGDLAGPTATLFKMTTLDPEELRQSGSYHVWLTLPTMEILDFTISVTHAMYFGLPTEQLSPIVGLGDELNSASQVRWVPRLVGDAPVRQLLFGAE